MYNFFSASMLWRLSLFLFFVSLYVFLAWVVSGGEKWWIIDYVDGQNIFYGDDAYRFFLSRSFLLNPDLYHYNFVLPGAMVLDGLVTTLTDSDLLLSRCFHALIGSLSICLIYDSARSLGVTRKISFFAILLLAFLPRFSLMSISFYGEAWLGGFICLSIWLYVKKKYFWLAFVASWFPLLRPEGIFFLSAYGVFFIFERRWKELLLLFAPGSLYFLYLNIVLPDFAEYNHWRIELRKILSKLSPGVGKWELFSFYSSFYTIPAVAGFFMKPMRFIWPAVLGAVLWLIWFQGLVFFDLATVESRYAFVLYPVLTLSWAVFFCTLLGKVKNELFVYVDLSHMVGFVAIAIIFFHFSEMSLVKYAIKNDGYKLVAESILKGEWNKIYPYRSRSERQGWKYLNDKMISAMNSDPGIDKLAIYDSVLFYNLDPKKIPEHIEVGLLTSGYMVFHVLLGGQTFIQHPGGMMYSYLKYGEPDFGEDESRVLVADVMPLVGYPYTWKSGDYELYLFSYNESDSPQQELKSKPIITPSYLNEMYKKLKKPGYFHDS